MASRTQDFYRVLSEAIRDLTLHGFDSEKRLQDWLERLRRAAEAALLPEQTLDDALRRALVTTYRRLVDRDQVIRRHPGISRYTLIRIKPRLRAELDRRILASANLIRLNRERSIQQTLQRFSGWATSIPIGGAPRTTNRRETNTDIRKSLAQLPFAERRVIVDQGHKLTAAINEIVAQDGGAIAAVWRSNWRQHGYDYREEHRERDGKVYLIRGSWAHQAGYVKPGEAGFFDQITKPAEEVFCRCFAVYLHTVADLPPEMVTRKGREPLMAARNIA